MRRRTIALTCVTVVAAGVAGWWLVPASPAPAEAAASPAIQVVTAKVGGLVEGVFIENPVFDVKD